MINPANASLASLTMNLKLIATQWSTPKSGGQAENTNSPWISPCFTVMKKSRHCGKNCYHKTEAIRGNNCSDML